MEYKDIIEIIYRENATQIQRMCYLYLGNEAMAEDAMQETFVKVYRGYRKFHNQSSIKTWVTRIAINVCKDMMRSIARTPYSEMRQDADLEMDYKDTEDRLVVSRAINRLPVDLREVVILFYYQELSTKEIAASIGVSRTTVEFRLKQARKILQKELKGAYFYE